MPENNNDILSNMCNNYIKSETFKLHLNNVTQPFIKTLLNEFGILIISEIPIDGTKAKIGSINPFKL